MTDLDKAREEYEREHDARAQHRERACDRYIAALEAEVKTVAQSVRKLCGKWDCDDLDELEDKLTALDELDSYSGHLKWMDKHYPLDVPYFAESEDVGCQVMRLSRKVMECEANLAAAEAQVEKLKGQDCASCSHTKQDTALYPPPPPNYEVYSYCGCPDSPCYMRVITPVDRCAHWSARLTAPEPKEETVNDGLCRASVPDHDDPYFSERPCTRKAMSGGYCWQHALTRSETMSAESTDKLTAAINLLTEAGYPTNDIAPLVSARDNLKGWTAGGHPTTSLLIDGVTNLVALLAEHEDLCKREHQMSARLTAPEPKEES